MGTLSNVYKILYSLEHKEKADYAGVLISPAKLDIDEQEWLEAIEMLLEEGLIANVRIYPDITGDTCVDIKRCRITIKGAQYLKENSAMAKFGKIATNVIEIAKP